MQEKKEKKWKRKRKRKEEKGKLGSRSLGNSATVTLGFCTILKRQRGKENQLCRDKANQNNQRLPDLRQPSETAAVNSQCENTAR